MAALAAGVACVAGEAAAADCEPPGWVRTPTASELAEAYPKTARQTGVEGRATLACRSEEDGRMVDCSVVGETPAGHGFGAAALSLVGSLRGTRPCQGASSLQPDGARLTMRFVLPHAEPPFREAIYRRDKAFARLGAAGPYYPERAARVGATGVVNMDCRVDERGRLKDCTVLDVSTPGYGFEFAAVRMAEKGWMTAGPENLRAAPPPDRRWRFRVIFDGRTR
ncbi:MAG: TonB family protein [Phenylobacterium sp.]|uniref:TonB family protein n=1 Tax=Phenylobacterium sp. TaxID=1871053 RepID=UPI001A3C102B|nr:TonB family protein [Phenylobacterium sp.]MBL8770457.1 TonB family protein [Phenylobacterium sp.]